MIFVRFPRVIIHPETLIRSIIGVFHRSSGPIFFAFDPEMIIPDLCQTALSATGF